MTPFAKPEERARPTRPGWRLAHFGRSPYEDVWVRERGGVVELEQYGTSTLIRPRWRRIAVPVAAWGRFVDVLEEVYAG